MNNKSLDKQQMLDKKLWDVRVLDSGGISYYYPEPVIGNDLDLKKRYRIAVTYKGRFNEEQHTKKLKYKIRMANGEIFSVAAKTQAEAKHVVDSIFGRNQYSISTMME